MYNKNKCGCLRLRAQAVLICCTGFPEPSAQVGFSPALPYFINLFVGDLQAINTLLTMTEPKRGTLIMRISWTETLRAMKIGEFVEAKLVDRINIVRHISRISKLENKRFTTNKIGKEKLIVRCIS